MEKLYYFFDMDYEDVKHTPGLPFRLLLESVGYVGLHWHRDVEIVLILKGELTVTNSRGRTRLKEGDLMLINSNEMHCYVETEDSLMVVLQADPDLFSTGGSTPETVELFLWEKNLIPREADRELKNLFARMMLEYWEGGEAHELFCTSYLYRMAGILRRTLPKGRVPAENRDRRSRQLRIKKVLDYLHSHYMDKIRLADAAGELNLSPHYLSHIVKEGTGWSFQENLNMIRAGKAVDMMLRSSSSLLEISIASGFSDPKYFNSYFRRLFGMTPRELKRQPDWKGAILKHYKNQGLPPEDGRELLEGYLLDDRQ